MAVLLENALQNLVQGFVTGLPNVIYAVITLVAGYIIGRVVGVVVEKIVVRSKIDTHLREKEQLSFKLSEVLGTISKWLIYLIFLQEAAMQLNVLAISAVINAIIAFIPGIVGAVLVIIASYAIGIYVKENIVGSKEIYTNVLGKTILFFIVYVGVATALPMMNIDATLINSILLIIMGSLGVGVAIAFGLGLKDTVAEVAKHRLKRVLKTK